MASTSSNSSPRPIRLWQILKLVIGIKHLILLHKLREEYPKLCRLRVILRRNSVSKQWIDPLNNNKGFVYMSSAGLCSRQGRLFIILNLLNLYKRFGSWSFLSLMNSFRFAFSWSWFWLELISPSNEVCFLLFSGRIVSMETCSCRFTTKNCGVDPSKTFWMTSKKSDVHCYKFFRIFYTLGHSTTCELGM